MYKGLKLLLLGSACYSLLPACTNKQGITQWYYEKIKGDWANRELVFSFRDSLCLYPHPIYGYTHYSLQGDTLVIKEKVPYKLQGYEARNYPDEWLKFKIVDLNDDSLLLKPINFDPEVFKDLSEVDDMIVLGRLTTPGPTIKAFKKLVFSSSNCFGFCSSFNLEFNSDGNCFYEGLEYTPYEGQYRGSMNPYELSGLTERIQALDLNRLEQEFNPNWSDGQVFYMILEVDGQSHQSYIYGNDSEPVGLRILLQYLMSAHLYVDWQQSNDDHVFKSEENVIMSAKDESVNRL